MSSQWLSITRRARRALPRQPAVIKSPSPRRSCFANYVRAGSDLSTRRGSFDPNVFIKLHVRHDDNNDAD